MSFKSGKFYALLSSVVFLFSTFLLPSMLFAQLAAGRSKFLGNIMDAYNIPSDFPLFWNQVTPENAGKWGSVQGTDTSSFNWSQLDVIYKYAISHNFPFKFHNLIWGAQQPNFMMKGVLDSAQQYRAIQAWIDSCGHRYPNSALCDVVNEPIHTPPDGGGSPARADYIQALGGAGKTGWDWVIKAFELAKAAFPPTTKLLLNEYGVINSSSTTAEYIQIIDLLKERGLIDGIGVQAHTFSVVGTPVSVMEANLDSLATTGLPIYISELDINEQSDATQLQEYQTIFPVLYQFPDVKGVTLWGYQQNYTWIPYTYLITDRNAERPAMQWLVQYFQNYLVTTLDSPVDSTGVSRNPLITWAPSIAATVYRVQVGTDSTFSNIVTDTTVSDTSLRLSPLTADSKYYWHVLAMNTTDTGTYSDTVSFTTGSEITAIEDGRVIPSGFSLSQNYPNPFNPTTQIEYSVAKRSYVSLDVYNVLGEKVATLFAGEERPGNYTATFNGNSLPSGVYFYRLTAGSFSAVKKLMLIK
jgi:endo-1,4-beta-xylanase